MPWSAYWGQHFGRITGELGIGLPKHLFGPGPASTPPLVVVGGTVPWMISQAPVPQSTLPDGGATRHAGHSEYLGHVPASTPSSSVDAPSISVNQAWQIFERAGLPKGAPMCKHAANTLCCIQLLAAGAEFPALEHRDLVCELVDASLAPHKLAVLHQHLAVGVRDLRQALRNLSVLAGDDRIAIVDLLQKALRQSPQLRLSKALKLIAGEHEQQCAELACPSSSANAPIARSWLHHADHAGLAQALP